VSFKKTKEQGGDMDFVPKARERICQLLNRGVDIPNPETIDIGSEVNIEQIAAKDVKIYPGCRLYGGKTVISAGCRLGHEAPVTIEDCQLGEKVELKGGFFSGSVFLEKANMGMGAHVREASILEEQASGAHCVGLKQTILFPFVTLGSLINFCDCLMSGGTSRQNHSEVGSSYIHFNFTPDADKTTPSLLGDVPRGVMLNQPPIFLGGQGGIIGPVRLGYGNVVAAGSILRHDYPEDNKLICETGNAGNIKNYVKTLYPNIGRVVENNIIYLANLTALEAWYTDIRKPFMESRPLGNLIYAGAMEKLSLAKKERSKRLKALAEKASASGRRELQEQMAFIEGIFVGRFAAESPDVKKYRDAFLQGFAKAAGRSKDDYIETIQGLPAAVSVKGVKWLASLVDDICNKVRKVMPSVYQGKR